jgi:DNA invertase Pin-like site-specific DNA recombinase
VTGHRRCAIYTRKSTDEGLEQDFNSLQAQREACEAFIKSQRHEGWRVLPEAFDDGGYSGGTMDRPALARLMAAVQAGEVDVVLVYKVDRLSRSLVDFARMVEMFDAKGVSFVSITQQFNTTTSMGRLTLNVLLSFAQFEREVTGERIRDKIAASKKKGMWMGGVVPLGYDIKARNLTVNEGEATTVRLLFRRYLELGTVRQLKEVADKLGLVTKQRKQASGRTTGGQAFTRGHLYQLLSNPIYVGEIAHKGVHYPGRHEAIVDRATFEAVQRRLKENASPRPSATNATAPSLLTGLVFDETGDRLCPTHASKKGRRYRYYISKRLMHRTNDTSQGWRVPAAELEAAVIRAACDFLKDELRLVEALDLEQESPEDLNQAINRAGALATKLEQGTNDRRRDVLSNLLLRATLHRESIRLEINPASLAALLRIAAPASQSSSPIPFAVAVQLRRRGIEAKLVVHSSHGRPKTPDPKLVLLLADAHRWLDDLVTGRVASLRELARRYNRDKGEASRTLPLAFLAPDIVEAILQGHQPVDLTPHRLKRSGLSMRWEQQRGLLGFRA